MRRSKIGWLASFAVAAVCGLVGQAQAVTFTAVGSFNINSTVTPGLAGDTFALIVDVDPIADAPNAAGWQFNGTADLLINNVLIYDDLFGGVVQAASSPGSFSMAILTPSGFFTTFFDGFRVPDRGSVNPPP